ncbi:MAG: ANTAR domain-containing protein, partial [Turicibacter sp.]|nr:ANTAR domain-containing protein [Turicibacter sp.]
MKYGQTVKQLESKVNQLEKAQQTEKIIRAAKRTLQQHQNMTEDEAHRYIQKRSMELRISKLEFAQRILKIYQKKS